MRGKRPTGWEPEASISFWIGQVSRLLSRHVERSLWPLGFGMAYVPVVIALRDKGTLTQRDLANLVQVEQPTMAGLLGRMERDGMILREADPTDRRVGRVLLTEKAKSRVSAAEECMAAVADRATAGFTEAERATLIGLLQRVVKNLDDSVNAGRRAQKQP